MGKNNFSCFATDSVLISVIPPTRITSSGNAAVCVGQSIQLFAKGAQKYQWLPALYLSNPYTDRPVLKPLKDTLLNYTVVGSDYKNCFSDTSSVQIRVYPLPQIQLSQKDITIARGSSVHLSSINSPDAIYWRWSPQQGLNNATVPDPIASPQQTTTYRCEAVNAGGCISGSQVTIHIACNNSNFFIPNTFSPNGDGMNDVFYVRGTGLYGVKSFRIFNRLGQILYERLNIAANNVSSGWDGTYRGEKMPADVYVCVIELFCEDGTVLPVKETTTLIR
jgi:gliding motility-associated-like protein